MNIYVRKVLTYIMDLIVALRLALLPVRIEEPYGYESCACGTLLYYFHVWSVVQVR